MLGRKDNFIHVVFGRLWDIQLGMSDRQLEIQFGNQVSSEDTVEMCRVTRVEDPAWIWPNFKGLKEEIKTRCAFVNAALLRKFCKIALVSGKMKGLEWNTWIQTWALLLGLL